MSCTRLIGVGLVQIWLRSYLQGLGDGWLFIRWGSMLYHSLNGWFMVGSFSNWIESESSRVGWWLAVFQMRFNALLLSQWLGNGWQFFKLIWDHIFKGWMMVGCFSDGVQCSYFMNGWVMVGSFSNWIESLSLRVGWWLAVLQKGVQCFFTSSMVGPRLAVFQYICNAYLKWLDGGWQIFISDLVHDE